MPTWNVVSVICNVGAIGYMSGISDFLRGRAVLFFGKKKLLYRIVYVLIKS